MGVLTMSRGQTARLATQIGIALTAGMISIVPVAHGAPVLDSVVSGGASVVNSGTLTDIKSTTKNNVINWKDFSVGAKETVQFDGGSKTNNYLNIVTGANTSQINGVIRGGNNVYLVNPNGVIFGNSAQVDVGNLYVSTRKASELDLTTTNASGDMTPLVGTGTAAGDVVNMGSIAATSVTVEGGNVKFMDVEQVTDSTGAVNSNVTINATGSIRLGQNIEAANYGLSTAADNYATNLDADGFTTITTAAGLAAISSNLAGDYELNADIDLSGTSYTPLGDATNSFTGTFDGNFYEISGLAINYTEKNTYGGVFGYTNGATIKNLGVTNGSVTAAFAGGIVGKAVNTTFTNVYNNNVTIKTNAKGTDSTTGAERAYAAGGIAGSVSGTTIDTAYNTGSITGNKGGAIVGYIAKDTHIKNVYNANSSVDYGVAGVSASDANTNSTITNGYTTGVAVGYNTMAIVPTYYTTNASSKASSDYKATSTKDEKTNLEVTSGLNSLSNSGLDDTTWRIYEGQSLPLLRAFLRKNIGTVTVNYNYTQGSSVSGTNNGSDLTLKYNNNNIDFSDVTYTNSSTTVDTSLIKQSSKTYRDVLSADAKSEAVFYTGQDGYDLVGNNITITPIEVDVSNILDGKKLTKVYDGTNEVDDEEKKALFNASSSSVSGILEGDGTAEIDTSGINVVFNEIDAGLYTNAVIISGGLKVSNKTGYYNYKLSATSTSLDGKALDGEITQAKLTISFASDFNSAGTAINREYDGTVYTDSTGTATADSFSLSGLVNNETVDIAITDGTGTYVDDDTATKTAGTHQVKYTGIKLTGDNAKNYQLVDADGNTLYSIDTNGVGGVNESAGATLYGTGTISKLNIANTGFNWYTDKMGTAQSATRAYDGTSTYTGANGHLVLSDAMPTGDDVTFTVNSAAFIKSSDGSDATTTANVKDAKGVAYTITISGDDAVNYTLDGSDIVSGGTGTVYGAGKITPRVLNLKVSDKSNDKTYDGTTAVYNNESTKNTNLTLSDGYIVYGTEDTDYHLIESDPNGTTLSITGLYDDANVNYANGTVKARDITYTVQVVDKGGTASQNYVLNANGATTLDYTGSGIIGQKEIDAISFANVSKTYDTSASVLGQQENDKISLSSSNTWLVGTDTLETVFDTTKITGTYGTLSGDTFTASADVARDANNGVIAKDVAYTGVRSSLTNNNYKLSDNIADTQYGAGTINPLTITDRAALSLTAKDTITKVYDGDSRVSTTSASDAKSWLNNLTTEVGGQTVSFDYTVADTSDATYASENASFGAAQDVTYRLTVTESGNYAIDSSLLNADGKLEWTFTNGGVITPRDLTATAAQTGITKVYDATQDVYATINGVTKLVKDSDAVTLTGLVEGDTYTATAEYSDKNVANGKTITYTIGMDSTTRGNYRLLDANKNELSNDKLYGTGDITRRDITVSFDSVTKTFDNTTAVNTSDISYTFGNTINGDSITLDSAQYNASYDSENVGSRTVSYDTVLTGTDAGNYRLVNADGKEITSTTGAGTITAKTLTDADINIALDAVTKVYDTTTDVTYDHSSWSDQAGSFTASDAIQNGTITIGGVTLTLGDTFTLKDAQYNSAGVDANSAQYTLKIDDTIFGNFDFSGVTAGKYDSTNHYLYATTAATIAAKNVTASLTNSPADSAITKVYDGTTAVVQDVTNKVALDGIFAGDDAVLDTSQLNARYAGKDVAFDSAGNVTSQDVYYDATLKGASAANYKLIDSTDTANTAAGNSKLTLTGTGTITQMALTPDFEYTEITSDLNNSTVSGYANRTYDATSSINSLAAKTITGANGETITLDSTKITGTYGNWTSDASGEVTATGASGTEQGTFTANGDVNWDEANTTGSEADRTGYKAVSYTGLENALTNATGSTGFKVSNYTIANTVYFTEAAKKGKIRRLALTQDQVKADWASGQVVREYDGTSSLNNINDYLSMYVDLGNGSTKVPIAYTYNNAAIIDDTGAAVADVGEYRAKLTITGIESKEFNNFVMDSSWVNSFNKEYISTAKLAKITPRVITAHVLKDADTGFTKIYDGTTAVADASAVHDNLVIDKGILDKDAGTVNIAWTAAYDDKNAGDDKAISYKLTLTGNAKGNYTLDSANTTKGNATETDSTTYDTTGDIEKRALYVDWTNGAVTGIDREYQGASVTTADADNTAKNQIAIVTGATDTGVVSGDKVSLVNADIAANYVDSTGTADGNVSRASDGTVLAKDVYFSNFTLTGDDSANYTIAAVGDTDKLIGTGTITPIALNIGLNADPTKVYDGSTALADAYATAGNIKVLDSAKVITGDTLGIALATNSDGSTLAPSYSDKNAGTNKEVTYKLTYTNANYDLVNTDATDNTAVTATGSGALTLTATTGTIEKRTLEGLTIADATKVYDGTTDVIDAAKNIGFTNIVKGDSINIIATGTYDNANAGKADGSDELLDHSVNYTIALGTDAASQNYQLATVDTTALGAGTITRRGLTIVANPASVRVGEAIPDFTGYVTGYVTSDAALIEDFQNNYLSFKTADDTTTAKPGKYAVYGWYTNGTGESSLAGNYGQNYTFSQLPANDTAFTVELVDPGREYHENVNPKTQFIPDRTAYNQAAMDYSGAYRGNGAAALEYQDSRGTVLGKIAINGVAAGTNNITGAATVTGSVDTDATVMARGADASYGIAGGNVVNIEGVAVATSAEVSVENGGEVVNLEVRPLTASEIAIESTDSTDGATA